jgi:hypothetical protein
LVYDENVGREGYVIVCFPFFALFIDPARKQARFCRGGREITCCLSKAGEAIHPPCRYLRRFWMASSLRALPCSAWAGGKLRVLSGRVNQNLSCA